MTRRDAMRAHPAGKAVPESAEVAEHRMDLEACAITHRTPRDLLRADFRSRVHEVRGWAGWPAVWWAVKVVTITWAVLLVVSILGLSLAAGVAESGGWPA